MLGMRFLLLWPLMGLIAFLASLAWYLIRRPSTINAGRNLKIYVALCLSISLICTAVQAADWFWFTHDYAEFVFYGLLMTWPLALGVGFGWIVGYWIILVARRLGGPQS